MSSFKQMEDGRDGRSEGGGVGGGWMVPLEFDSLDGWV
jgi:hypothetical protein